MLLTKKQSAQVLIYSHKSNERPKTQIKQWNPLVAPTTRNCQQLNKQDDEEHGWDDGDGEGWSTEDEDPRDIATQVNEEVAEERKQIELKLQ